MKREPNPYDKPDWGFRICMSILALTLLAAFVKSWLHGGFDW